MKRSLKWPLRLGITLLILYIGICFYMKWAQKSFLFHPTVVAENHGWALPDNAKEVWLATEDGARINAIHYRADSSRGAVLFLHGNGGNVESSAADRDRFLRNHSDVLYVDYRGYGKSTGELYEQGLYYDAEAAYEYLKGDFPENKITVYGQSLGSGVGVKLASEYRPRLLILETPYTSILEVAQGDYPWLPVSWLLDFPLRARDHIGQVQCPVLIFHGTADETIPYAMGEEMSKLANKATLITIPGAKHNGCDRDARYHEALDNALR